MFLHERTTRDGARRTIAVEAREVWEGSRGVELAWTCRDPQTGRVVSESSRRFFRTSDLPVRLFAAQPHPNDPARFTIRYQRGDTRGALEGFLMYNGSVTICPGDANSDATPLDP